MWQGYKDALANYHNIIIEEWIQRGYRNTMNHIDSKKQYEKPEWLGSEKLHKSHRSNLLRKDFNFYKQYDWKETTTLEYFWPKRITF